MARGEDPDPFWRDQALAADRVCHVIMPAQVLKLQKAKEAAAAKQQAGKKK